MIVLDVSSLPRSAHDDGDVGEADPLELGPELDADIAAGGLVGRADRDAEQDLRLDARPEPDIGEEADLLDGAGREHEVRGIAAADPEPPLDAEPEPIPADARDQLAAGGQRDLLDLATDLDVGVAVLEAGARRRIRRAPVAIREAAGPRVDAVANADRLDHAAQAVDEVDVRGEHAVGAIAGALVERREVEVVGGDLHARETGRGAELVGEWRRRDRERDRRHRRAECQTRASPWRRHLDEVVEARWRDEPRRDHAAQVDVVLPDQEQAVIGAGTAHAVVEERTRDALRLLEHEHERPLGIGVRAGPGRVLHRRDELGIRARGRRVHLLAQLAQRLDVPADRLVERRRTPRREVALPAGDPRIERLPGLRREHAEHLDGGGIRGRSRRHGRERDGRRRGAGGRAIRAIDQDLRDIADLDPGHQLADHRARQRAARLGDRRGANRHPVLDRGARDRMLQAYGALESQRCTIGDALLAPEADVDLLLLDLHDAALDDLVIGERPARDAREEDDDHHGAHHGTSVQKSFQSSASGGGAGAGFAGTAGRAGGVTGATTPGAGGGAIVGSGGACVVT